jgi:hypothetical protein
MILKYNLNGIFSFSGIRNKRATLALWLALMFIVALLVVSFHHHDGKEHSDCPVCAVKCPHGTNATFSLLIFSLPSSFFPTLLLFISYLAQTSQYFSPALGRSPPHFKSGLSLFADTDTKVLFKKASTKKIPFSALTTTKKCVGALLL